MAASPDPSFDRIVSNVRVHGKPRPAPLVQGAFISLRVSKPGEQTTFSMQERRARRYVERELGIPVLEVFIDGKSGMLERKEYGRMIQRALLGLCSHVVLYDFDRFGRDDVKMLADFDRLERRGAEVHDIHGRIDRQTAGQKAHQANQEVRANSRRTLDAMLDRAQNEEEYNMPRRAPWGYRRTLEPGKPEIHPENGPIVTELFQRYDKGERMGDLTRWFNARTGLRKRTSGIAHMLAHEYYAGIDIYNKVSHSKIHGSYVKDPSEWVIRRHDHPLIDMPTFERVQARLGRDKNVGQQRAASPRYALTGLVHCAHCNLRLSGQTGRKPHYVSYQCPLCYRARSGGRVERVAQDALRAVPLHPRDIGSGAYHRDPVTEVEAITARIEKVRARRARIIIKREEGEYEEADYRLAMADTDRELADLVAQREQVAQEAQDAASVDATLGWLESLSNWMDVLDPEKTTVAERNSVYCQFFTKMVLDFEANTLTVHWMPALAKLVGRDRDTLPL